MGFFGGGGKTTTTASPQSTMSPMQEQYLASIMPFQLENARIQTDFAQRGHGDLTSAVEGAKTSLPDILQMSAAERAIPGATARTTGAVLPGMVDSYNYLGGVGSDPRMSGIVQGLTEGPKSATLDSVLAALAPGGSLNATQAFSTRGITGGAAPTLREHEMDPNVLLKPIETRYKESILPGITQEAMRVGAVGGSDSGKLVTQAAGRFGEESAATLAQNKANLMNAAANILGAETGAYRAGSEAETSAARLELENLIGQRKLGIEGATSAGNLAMALEELGQRGELGAGQLINEEAKTGTLAATQRAQLAQQLVTMGMAPEQAEAALAAAERSMGLQQAQVPLNLSNVLLSAATGVPSMNMPFSPQAFPGGTVSSSPSAGSEAGSAMSSVMQMAMMAAMIYSMSSAKTKRDIEFVKPSYLQRVRDIPLAEWNYKWDPEDAPRRVGPIRELSPYQIKGPGLTMNPLGYAGLLHAGMMELDGKVSMLERALGEVRANA